MNGGKMYGTREMSKKIRDFAARYSQRVAAAEYVELSIDATEMKARTPVDTTPNAPHPGQLRNSITVQEPVITKARITTLVTTTGPANDYAVHVHENPWPIHPIGQWKFMESVLQESAPYMNARLSARLHLDKEIP